MKFLNQIWADRGITTLIVTFLIALVLIFKPWIHGFDGMGYYSWLRSVAIDGDLDLANEFEHFGFEDEIVRTDTGYTAIQYTIGVSVLWSPFFLAAHIPSLLLQTFGFDVAADGYGPQYAFAICIGSAIYAFIGLLLAYCVARQVSGRKSALLATTMIWLASGVTFYMFLHPSMSHANDVFVNSLVIAIWFWTRKKRTRCGWLALGASIGLATLVRQQNATLVLFPAIEWLLTFWENTDKQRWHTLVSGALFALGGLIVFSPQLYVWKRVFGQWILLNPHMEKGNVTFNFLQPQLFTVLFSADRSLFFFTPVFLLGVLGLWTLRRRTPRLSLMLFVTWAVQVYLVSCSSSGGAGTASFGRRVLLNGAPIYVIGLAALVETLLKQNASPHTLWVAGCGLVAWNFLLIAQYITDLLPHGTTSETYWEIAVNQVRVIGVFLKQLSNLLAQRFGRWR